MGRILISNIKMPVRHTEEEVFFAATSYAKKFGIEADSFTVYKKSLDARRKSDIHFVYSVAAETQKVFTSRLPENISVIDEVPVLDIEELKRYAVKRDNESRVVVVGSGPCGLFAAYLLSECGVNTIVIERGSDVDTRSEKVKKFWDTGVLDKNTNVQFGEGGAGTFSDGKLNTRIGDPLQRYILEVFVKHGAPEEILYQAKPHIGTDLLKNCVKNIRKSIIKNGGTVMFDTCLTDIRTKNGVLCGVELNNSDIMDCDTLILAPGHSSRDTYEMLAKHGVLLEQKPFAAGVRIEHSREFINEMQYGAECKNEFLPTADYRLAYNGADRSCYSFCMCPGGVVVNASSEPESLVVNGMSYHSRMERNSNSALVVSVRPEDFESDNPLAGVEFQRKYEKLAYSAAGGRGVVQLSRDFMADKVSSAFDGVLPSFTGKTEFVDLRTCLPSFISDTLKDGLVFFEKRIKGFSTGGAVLTGVEMRTSAPLRIKRDTNCESVSTKGLFPAGEGAGYAGGIMSAAIDGIKVAQQIIKRENQ